MFSSRVSQYPDTFRVPERVFQAINNAVLPRLCRGRAAAAPEAAAVRPEVRARGGRPGLVICAKTGRLQVSGGVR